MQKLVNETFQKLWFTPTPSHDQEAMNRKILNITDVVCIYLFLHCFFLHCLQNSGCCCDDSVFIV